MLSRTEFLITNLKQYFGNDLLVLTSPGISSIVVFREKASTLFNITDEVTSDLDTSLSIVSKHVTNEVKGIAMNKNKYTTEFDRDSALESVSDTVMSFLAMLSPKLDKTLPAIIIGSMITTALHCHPKNKKLAQFLSF